MIGQTSYTVLLVYMYMKETVVFTESIKFAIQWKFVIFCFPENYEQALSDFQECLKIQEAELEPDDRLLAETYPFSCYQPVSMKRSEVMCNE